MGEKRNGREQGKVVIIFMPRKWWRNTLQERRHRDDQSMLFMQLYKITIECLGV